MVDATFCCTVPPREPLPCPVYSDSALRRAGLEFKMYGGGWVRQYPGEKEITFPPFTCLETDGDPRVERSAQGEIVFFPLKVNHSYMNPAPSAPLLGLSLLHQAAAPKHDSLAGAGSCWLAKVSCIVAWMGIYHGMIPPPCKLSPLFRVS